MGMSGWPRNEKRELWAFVVKVDWLRRNLQECFLFRGNKREKDHYKLFTTCTSVRWKHSKIRFKDRNTNLCPPSLLTSNSCMSRSRELSSTQFDQSPVTRDAIHCDSALGHKSNVYFKSAISTNRLSPTPRWGTAD